MKPFSLEGLTGKVKEAEEALQKSEERYRQLFDGVPIGLFRSSPDGKLLDANPSLAKILGYPDRESLLPVNLADTYEDPRERQQFKALIDERGFVAGYKMKRRRRDGTVIWIETHSRGVRGPDGRIQYYEGSFQDVSDRESFEEELRRSESHARRLAFEKSVLVEIGRIISSTTDIEEVYKSFADEVKKLLPFDRLVISLVERGKATMVPRFVEGPSVPGRNMGEVLPLRGSFGEAVIKSRRGIRLEVENEEEAASRFPGLLPHLRAGLKSALSVPLFYRDEAVGVLHIFSGTGKAYREEDLPTAQSIADQIAGAVANAQLFLERKQAGEVLRRNEERFRLISKSLPAGVFEMDISGACLYTNTKWQEIFDVSLAESLEVRWTEFCHPEEREKVEEEFSAALRNLGGFSRDIPIRTRKGEVRWIHFRSSPILSDEGVRHAGTVEDITDRRKAGEALKEERDRAQKYLDVAGVIVAVIDANQRVSLINKKGCEVLGHKEKDIIGANWFDTFFPGSDRDRVKAAFRMLMAEEAGSVEYFESSMLSKSGEEKLIAWRNTVLRDQTGNPIGTLSSGEDITDRKRTEEALNKAKVAEEASRAKGEFLAHMSHEIRTPLNAIIGMTELAMDAAIEDGLRNSLLTITQEADALLVIINEILDFSKIEAGKIRLEEIPFDLSLTMEHVAANITFQAAQKGLEFRSDRSPDLPSRFMGNPGRLRQILLNLSSNALKFTHKGEICIKAEMAENLGERVKIRFSVTDTGIGIPEDKRTTIFESFTQADASTTRKYGGTGLGLAISKRLAGLMGGEIGVESEEGKGSTFWFTAVLAKLTDEATLPKFTGLEGEELDAAEEGLLWPGRILLAEDYKTNQRVFTEQFNRVGCKVVLAENGKKAVEHFAAGDFDLVFMDVHMPEMDGLTATNLIRRQEEGREKRTPIIALTASVLAADHQACRDAGMDDFLEKPLKRAKLLVMLKKWLGPGQIDPLYRRRPEEGTESGLPDSLPGLDIRKAMAALACDPAMYREIAATFYEENLDTVKAMRDVFAVRDWATLERLAHSLKSTGGAIGARVLQERALELEKRSREADAVPPAPELIDQIETALRQVMGSLTSLGQTDRREPAPRVVKQLDPEALAPILREFARVITIAETGSIQTLLSTLKQHCDDEAVPRLEKQLDSYDYEDALGTLREIGGRIGVTIPLNP